MEAKLIPYQAHQSIEARAVLVFAPHPDDEVFGCGGAIMRHIEQGVPVRVIVVSDGAYGLEGEERLAYSQLRQRESLDAARLLGYGTPIFWDYPDRGVVYGEALVRRMLAAMGEADLIYAPSILEMHPDHRAVGMAAVEALRRLERPATLAAYEVGIPLTPNMLLDISQLQERKMAAMRCFTSQNAQQRYDLHIAALNRYRTYTLPAEVTAAEAYILTSAAELANDPFQLYQSEYQRQRQLGLPLDGADIPLVSVIIRSMDRATLQDALDSVALQTYPHLEIVVVNAKGGAHRHLRQWCGPFPLRLFNADTALTRSQAANKGLAHAQGDYLIFLDDDDLFYPQHIERLMQAALQSPQQLAAYADVKVVDSLGQQLLVYDHPWSFERLLCANFLPIHAVLFSRQLLDKGCRIDENLDILEDWDFWLQLAQHTAFTHVPEITAIYRYGAGLSDHVQHYRKWREIVVGKWTDTLGFKAFEQAFYWAATQLDDLNQRTAYLNKQLKQVEMTAAEQAQHLQTLNNQLAASQATVAEQAQHLEALKNQFAASQATVAEQGQQLDALNNQLAASQARVAEQQIQLTNAMANLQEILQSNSWRITSPVRSVSACFRRQKP